MVVHDERQRLVGKLQQIALRFGQLDRLEIAAGLHLAAAQQTEQKDKGKKNTGDLFHSSAPHFQSRICLYHIMEYLGKQGGL